MGTELEHAAGETTSSDAGASSHAEAAAAPSDAKPSFSIPFKDDYIGERPAPPLEERSAIFEVRLEKAEELRVLGNTDFKAASWSAALTLYRRALFHVEFEEMSWNFELLARPLLNSRTPTVYIRPVHCLH